MHFKLVENTVLKGKVVVVNALIYSRLNHALAVCPFSRQLQQELNEATSRFLWKSKINQVSNTVLTLPLDRGGLNLASVTARKEAFRMKLWQKIIMKESLPWRDLLVAEMGLEKGIGTWALAQKRLGLKGSNADPLQIELIDTWHKVRPHLRARVASVRQALEQPLLNNPEITWGGKEVVCSSLDRAEVVQLKHMVNTGGEIDVKVVEDALKQKNVKYRKSVVKVVVEKLAASVPQRWLMLLRKSRRPEKDIDVCVEFLTGKTEQHWGDMHTKGWHDSILGMTRRVPAAEKAWRETWPLLTTQRIWGSTKNTITTGPIFNTDFKIRHRKIYTRIILHQIDRTNHTRICACCNTHPEDLIHLFMDCNNIQTFTTQIKQLLKTQGKLDWANSTEWAHLYLFGHTGKGGYTALINTIIQTAKHTIYIARNYQMKEHKTIDKWVFFNNQFKLQIRTLHCIDPEHFITKYGGGHSLFRVEGGEVVFNF